MKLKKLMALALSGVLAVSMFAGCAKADVKPEDPTDPEGPVAVEGDISAGVAANIENLPAYVEFAGDSALSSALNYVVGFANVWQINAGYYENALKEIDSKHADLQNRLEKAVGVTKFDPLGKPEKEINVDIDNIGSNWALKAAEAVSTVEIDDAKAVQLYAASGVIEEEALNTLVAEAIDRVVTNYNNICREGGENGIYDYDYTVSVSTDVKEDNGAVATFVAVQVVRSATRS